MHAQVRNASNRSVKSDESLFHRSTGSFYDGESAQGQLSVEPGVPKSSAVHFHRDLYRALSGLVLIATRLASALTSCDLSDFCLKRRPGESMCPTARQNSFPGFQSLPTTKAAVSASRWKKNFMFGFMFQFCDSFNSTKPDCRSFFLLTAATCHGLGVSSKKSRNSFVKFPTFEEVDSFRLEPIEEADELLHSSSIIFL